MQIFREDWVNIPTARKIKQTSNNTSWPWIFMDLTWLWTRQEIGWLERIQWNPEKQKYTINPTKIMIRRAVSTIIDSDTSPIANTFCFKKWKITTRKPEESSVLDWHLKWLPLVPWVIQKWLLLKLINSSEIIYNWISAVKTIFGKPILPWDIIKLWPDSLSLTNENWENNVLIELLAEYRPDFRITYEELEEQFLSKKQLDKYILQSWEFRFVTWFSWIENEDNLNPQVWDVFQWYFDIPEDFHFHQKYWEEGIVQQYLLEEFAAQIGSISFWKKLNIEEEDWTINEEKRSVLTFNNSICRYSWLPITIWDSFKLVWRIKTIEKRTASFEYIWYDSHWNTIIQWEIMGNIVPIKIFKRLIK